MQSLLDEMEICLSMMGLPLDAPSPLVDLGNLPVLKLPSSFPTEQAGDESAGEELDSQPDEDMLLEDDPQEELGDSTMEAQARSETFPFSCAGLSIMHAPFFMAPVCISCDAEEEQAALANIFYIKGNPPHSRSRSKSFARFSTGLG